SSLDILLAERVDHVRAREHPLLLLDREAILHIRVLHDLLEPPARTVLAEDVGDHRLLLRRLREQEGERAPHEAGQPQHEVDCIVGSCASLLSAAGSRSGCSMGWTTPGTTSASSSGSSARPARCGPSVAP